MFASPLFAYLVSGRTGATLVPGVRTLRRSIRRTNDFGRIWSAVVSVALRVAALRILRTATALRVSTLRVAARVSALRVLALVVVVALAVVVLALVVGGCLGVRALALVT